MSLPILIHLTRSLTDRKCRRSITNAITSKEALVFGAAMTTVLLFSLTPATTRLAVTQIDGFWIGLARTMVGGVIAIPVVACFRLAPPKGLQDWKLLGLSAMGSFVAFPVLFSLGAQRTSGTHAALLMAAMPLFVSTTGMVINKKLPPFEWFIGAGIAALGEIAVILTRDSQGSAHPTFYGDFIVLCACILFSAGAVAGARLSARISPWSAVFWALIAASVALVPLALWNIQTLPTEALSFTTVISLLHLTIGAAIIANVCWVWALSKGGIVKVAPIQFAQPLCGVLFAALLVHEHLAPVLLMTAGIIVFGIVTAWRANSAPSDGFKGGLLLLAMNWLYNRRHLLALASTHKRPQ